MVGISIEGLKFYFLAGVFFKYPTPHPHSLIPPFKKIFNPPFPILFFQTLNVVILIALAKSQSAGEHFTSKLTWSAA